MDVAGRWTVGHGTRGDWCLAEFRYSGTVAGRGDWSLGQEVEWLGSIVAISHFRTSKSTCTCSSGSSTCRCSGVGRWCPDAERSRGISARHGAVSWRWCSRVVGEWILGGVGLDWWSSFLIRIPLGRLYSCVVAKWICRVILIPSHGCTGSCSTSSTIRGGCTSCKFWMELGHRSQTQSWCSRSRPCRYCALRSSQTTSICRLLVICLCVVLV